MNTKAKLVTLELVAGIFGWGWLVAGGFAVYFLVMAVGFNGAWSPFLIALVAGGVCKWLARGFDDHKRRVTVEADLIAKGMLPKEARQAWFDAYTGQRTSPAPTKLSPADPENEENRRTAEQRIRVISDYGAHMERNAIDAGSNVWDVKALPHKKEDILDAICLEIVREQDEKLVGMLEVGAMMLAYYQEGVGDRPLSILGINLLKEPRSSSKEEVMARAAKIATNPDWERYQAYRPIIEKDQARILPLLTAAKKLRSEMPSEKKREILG